MGRLKLIVAIALLFLSFLNGAEVGDEIINRANISYKIDNIDKNATTNDVKLVVAKTPAKIEFLTIDPTGSEEVLNPTKYQKDNKQVDMPPAKLPDGTLIETPSKVKVKEATKYLSDDLVIVRVTDLDRNTDANKQDIISVDIINQRTGEVERLYLIETSNNSGVFVGYLFTKTCSNNTQPTQDGALCCVEDDKIVAKYIDNETNEVVEAKATIPGSISALVVTKEQSKDVASMGSYIKYTISVENISSRSFEDVKLIDNLPVGVRYIEDSFRVNDKKATPTISKDGSTLSYIYPLLKDSQKIEYSYVVLIGPNSNKEVINRAYATASGAKDSNIATVKLELKDELYRNKGYIIGRVYIKDCNSSCGVGGAKLYMEDGRFVVTDSLGRYHFLDIDKGSHVVQIDTDSIPNYKVVKCFKNGMYSNGSISAFAEVGVSGIKRIDFCLKKQKSNLEPTFSINLKKVNAKRVKLNLKVEDSLELSNKEVYIKIPDGLEYIKSNLTVKKDNNILIIPIEKEANLEFVVNSNQPNIKEIEAILFYDKGKKEDLYTPPLVVALKTDSLTIKKIIQDSSKIALNAKAVDNKIEQAIKNKNMPQYSKDEVDSFGSKPQIVWPPKNWVPTMPSIKVGILYPKGAKVELYLNSKKVDLVHFEGILRDSKGKMQIAYFKGIDLYEGLNSFKAVIKKGKKVVATITRDIYLESGAPQSFEVIKEQSSLIADGKSEIVVALKLKGKSGHPLRAGLVGSFETDKDHQPAITLNGKGRYEVGSNGIAYIKIKPTTKAKGLKLKFKDKTLDIKLTMKPRDWIVVGFASGSVGYKTLSGNMEALDKKDIKKGFYVDKRVAFFAKGRVLGKWLLTIAYDSGKRDRELFDRIDKDRYYTVYEDASTQGNDAPSIKKLYIKLEKDDFYAMFGDFKTDISAGEFTSYNRNLNGFKSEYSTKNIKVILFASKQDSVHYYEEIRLDGTTGTYKLKSGDIVPNSQKVSVVTRDKDNKHITISSEVLVDKRDYYIDYEKGELYLKKSFFSVDNNFNPRYLIVEYDVEGADKSYYEYGSRVEYKNKNFTIGATAIKKDNSQGGDYLVGVDGEVKITKNLNLKAEWAKSKSIKGEDTGIGYASKVELKYQDSNKTIKAYYKKQDSSFGLGNISSSLSGTKIYGVDSSFKINKRLKFASTIYKSIDYSKDKPSISTIVVNPTIEYSDKKRRVKVGLKYVNATNKKADTRATLEYDQKINKKLTMNFSHEQSFRGDFARTMAGFNYKIDKNSSVFAQVQRLKEDDTKYSAIFGLNYQPWKNGELKLYRLYTTGSEDNGFSTVALSQKWKLSKRWQLITAIEQTFASNSQDNATIYRVEAKYNSNKVMFKSLVEYKNSSEDVFNIDSDLVVKKDKNLALSAGIDYRYKKDKTSKSKYVDAKVALAYRIDSKLIILDRLDFIQDYTKDDSKEDDSKKLINNFHLNYIFADNLEFGLYYGLKYEKDIIDDISYSSWSDMLSLDLLYKLNQNWDIGAQASILHSYTLNSFEYGFGLFIQRAINDNFKVRLGYNFSGFDDSDFKSANYHHQGVYLNFEVKFNQEDIKNIFNRADR